MSKPTGKLIDIMKSADSIDDYLKKVEDSMIDTTVAAELNKIIYENNLKPTKIFADAGIDRSYGYDILNGKKTPSRDKLLAILFTIGLDDSHTQTFIPQKTVGWQPTV